MIDAVMGADLGNRIGQTVLDDVHITTSGIFTRRLTKLARGNAARLLKAR
jgi:hypothetical protein